MRKYFTIPCLLVITMSFLINKTWGQGYIKFSKLDTATAYPYVIAMQVVNGETYKLSLKGNDVQIGQYPQGLGTVTKYAADGSVIYSTPLLNDTAISYLSMKVINGEVFVLGGQFYDFFGLGSPIIIARLHTDGSIAFVKYLETSGLLNYLNPEIQIVSDEILLNGTIGWIGNPITIGNISSTGTGNINFLAKISTSDGEITRSMFVPFYLSGTPQIEAGAIYLAGTDFGTTLLPVTIGNVPSFPNEAHIYVQKINFSNFSTVYARYFADSVLAFVETAAVLNGELHIAGRTWFSNFPVTNSSTGNNTYTLSDWENAFYVKLNADGTPGFSTYLHLPGSYTDIYNYPRVIKTFNGNTYVKGYASTNAGTRSYIYKFNSNNELVWNKTLNAGIGSFEIVNDEVYTAGTSYTGAYPVTNGSHYGGPGTGFFTHYNSTGNIIFSTFLNVSSNGSMEMKIDDNKVYLSGSADSANFAATDSSFIKGYSDNYVIVLKPDGTKLYSTFIGGINKEILNAMQVENGSVYIGGNTESPDYPVTDNVSTSEDFTGFLTKLSFCPANYTTSNDSLQPKIQTVCKYGLADSIIGQEIIIPGDSLPRVFLNGVSTLQHQIGGTTYQWQVATALTGPWTDIPNAAAKNYRPVIGGVDQYYRRNAFTPQDCGTAFIHTSDTALVIAGPLTAPTLNAGGLFVTCPSTAIVIGGSPTAAGGNPPYISYSWNMGIASVANPTVSPENNTIYTLTVTDTLGCQQLAQAVVLVYKANAGSNKNACASPVLIGSAPIAGLPGVIYAWHPASGLNDSTNAQPLAQPSVQTNYDLTLTIPKSGGGTCTTYDTVTVIPVSAPLNPNFAGADQVICLGSTASIGSTDEPGFVYAWSPSNYLSATSFATTIYDPGITIPTPDPATLQLSAYKNGCTFSDAVTIATIVSRAGIYCEDAVITIVGTPDVTPNINETYSWVKISGPGNFTGATNLPQVPISPLTGGITTYGLTVSYNGGSCYSETSTDNCNPTSGGCIQVNISPVSCPGFTANNGVVSLHASSIIPDAIYTWTPTVGLDTYTGNTVYLTDTVPRVYTVTATNAHDSSVHCSASISTNLPVFVAPVFAAPDTVVCAGEPVIIGLPAVQGYTYEWSGGDGLNNYSVSNPIATLDYSTEFHVLVTNADLCSIVDTVTVTVQNTPAYAGEDWLVCSNATVSLGSDSIPDTGYLWEPQSSNWQNGTNQFSAHPQVLVATSVTYALTTTTSGGCVSTDSVQVTVSNSPVIPDAPDVVACLGSGKLIGSPALPGVVYQWSPATGLNDATAAQPFASPTTNTTYTVVASFPGTCGLPATDQVTVTVHDPSFALPAIHFCPADGPVALGINAPPGMTYYQWEPYNLVTDYQTANPSTLMPPATTTIFTLFVEDQFGCYYTSQLTVIPYTDIPDAGANRSVCRNSPVHIGSVSNITGPSISYSWSPAAGLDNPASPNPLFTGTSPGTVQYVLTKTDNNIPCSATDTVLIQVVDIIPPLSSPTICRNSCVQIGTNPVNGIIYQWSPASGLSNASIANPIACIDSTSTTYTLTANDQAGCITSATVVIGVNTVPGLQLSVPVIIACVGDNPVFNPALAAGSYSYLWSPDDGTLSNIYIANPVIQTATAGTSHYSLQVTDNTTGCTNSTTADVQVNICSPYGEAGNFMWFDTNENGIQDPGELGVSGAVVKLYNNIGFNVSTTVTDANGFYNFPGVSPGSDYYIIFSKPAGYEFTVQNVGGITASDNSKADATGRTINFNLITGDDITNIDAGIKPGQIVPVTLLSFTARLQSNRTVLLNWQTSAEINNDYFDVERSTDGLSFTAIGRVNGHGTTSMPHNYSLIDLIPAEGFNYYRLRQVDFNDHFTWSNIEAVELKDPDAGAITAWYNNQNNSIQLIFKESQVGLQVKLYASNGQLIKSAIAANNTRSYSLGLPVLATGVYMLQVITDKVRYSKKMFIGR